MTEPASTDIAKLFALDPLQHSDQDVDTLVEFYRKARTSFKLGNMTAGKIPTGKAKEVAQLADALNIELDL